MKHLNPNRDLPVLITIVLITALFALILRSCAPEPAKAAEEAYLQEKLINILLTHRENIPNCPPHMTSPIVPLRKVISSGGRSVNVETACTKCGAKFLEFYRPEYDRYDDDFDGR